MEFVTGIRSKVVAAGRVREVKDMGTAGTGICTRKCKLFSLTIKPLFAALASTCNQMEKDARMDREKKTREGSSGWWWWWW